MEQLQPVIKHRFWILSGLIVVLSFVGWIMGSKQLEEDTKTKISKIESAVKGLPDEKADHENKDWIDKLLGVNGKRKDQSDLKADELHKKQVAEMIWPASVAKHFEGRAPRAEGRDLPGIKKEIAQTAYADGYLADVIEPLVQMVKPYDDSTELGIVKFQANTMRYFPTWKNYEPTWDEMWDVQEDYWLTRSLLGAINKVNVTSTHYYDANINEIGKLMLYAGSKPELAGYKGKSGGAGGGSRKNKKPKFGLRGAGVGGSGGTSTQQAGNRSGGGGEQKSGKFIPIDTNTKIEEIKVFGDPVKTNVDQAKSPTAKKLAKEAAKQNAQKSVKPRYVENGETYPFKTRGFILSLNMKSEALPQLLKELNQLAWPVEIKRVHWKLRNADLYGDLQDRLALNTEDQGTSQNLRGQRKFGDNVGRAQTLQADSDPGQKQTPKNKRKSSARKDDGKTTVKKRPDRRSDIQVEIAGVLTIYQPSEKSKITLSSVAKKKNVKPKSETKDKTTGPISKTNK